VKNSVGFVVKKFKPQYIERHSVHIAVLTITTKPCQFDNITPFGTGIDMEAV
jgi:hypothetical protein